MTHECLLTLISLFSKALCPDDKICVAMGVRSVVAPTLNALFYALKGAYSALGSIGEVMLRWRLNWSYKSDPIYLESEP